MLKSKITTIILCIICVVTIVALILVPRLSKSPTIYDTNDRDIGKETVEWIEDYKNVVESEATEEEALVKGEYETTENCIRLEKQETIDADNYGSGYDLMYIEENLTDFAISADITIEDTEFNEFAKAGFKIAVDEEKYFSVFILPSTGEFCLLSTLDGGLNWVQIWPCFSIPGFDMSQPTQLKLVKTGEVIEVYVNGELKYTETEFKIGPDTPVKVGLTSEAVSPVVYDQISVEAEGRSGAKSVKGDYVVEGNTVTLQNQETIDADNYGSGYDLFYFGGKYKDFTVSADILIEDEEFNEFAKAGFKIAVDEEKYFSVFILPSTGEFCLLSTLDGGLNWVQIWPCISIPGFDIGQPTQLKLVKTGEVIEVYVNGELKHTETEFRIGEDTEVKMGLTSEAVSPVVYKDVVIEEGQEGN